MCSSAPEKQKTRRSCKMRTWPGGATPHGEQKKEKEKEREPFANKWTAIETGMWPLPTQNAHFPFRPFSLFLPLSLPFSLLPFCVAPALAPKPCDLRSFPLPLAALVFAGSRSLPPSLRWPCRTPRQRSLLPRALRSSSGTLPKRCGLWKRGRVEGHARTGEE